MDESRRTGPAGRQQFAFDLKHRPASGRDDFVRGAANTVALDAVLTWPAWSHFALLLVGPAGSGKSHLARVWASISGGVAIDRSQIDMDQLVSSPAAQYVVEDVDRGPVDEVALFHLLNHASEVGGQILLTARIPPAKWDIKLADLMSRLRAATLVEIGPPDDDLLEAVLVKLFADRQIDITGEVVHFAMRRMERSLASAGALVERIDRLSLEEKRRVTTRLVERALTENPASFVS